MITASANSVKGLLADIPTITREHEEIRRWAEMRGGSPARINCPTIGSMASSLRIHFAGRGDETMLEMITWEEFFREFERRRLTLYYQDRTTSGSISRFHRFMGRPAEA